MKKRGRVRRLIVGSVLVMWMAVGLSVFGSGETGNILWITLPEADEDWEDDLQVSGAGGFTILDGSQLTDEQLEREQYLSQESRPLNFTEVPLGVVIQALSESIGLPYLAPHGELFDELVTLRVVANPFLVLEMLSTQYGFRMRTAGIAWEFYEEDWERLVPRTYQLRYSDLGETAIRPPSVAGAVRSGGGGWTGGGSSTGGSGDGVFVSGVDRLVRDLESLLHLPVWPQWQTDGELVTVHDTHPFPVVQARTRAAPITGGGQVIYVPETSSLMVVATLPHHRLVEEYLRAVDQRQRLVKIQAMIVETSQPESLSHGVDWSSVSGARLGVSHISREFAETWSRGVSQGGDDVEASVAHARQSSRTDTALLTASELAWTLNLLETSGESRVINDPVAVTLNRRPVRFETVTEIPVQIGSSSTTSTVATSAVQQTEYIEIGFFLDVIPQVVPGGMYGWDEEAVRLDVSIVVSNQVGQQDIGDRPYPITARRTYAYSVVVPSGTTLAIGGLREEGENEVVRGIPLLGDLPLLGFLFRYTEREVISRNLVAYITPTLLDGESPEFRPAGE